MVANSLATECHQQLLSMASRDHSELMITRSHLRMQVVQMQEAPERLFSFYLFTSLEIYASTCTHIPD